MAQWLNDSITDQLDSDDDEELNNEWGISQSYAARSSANQSLAKETQQEMNHKSDHYQTKSNDDRDDSIKRKIESILISDSDEESDKNLSNQLQSVKKTNQVSSPPFRITSSDKKSDQTRRNDDIQGKSLFASESCDIQSVTAESGKSVKLFHEMVESDCTLTQSDNEAVETIENENPGQCNTVSVDNLNPTRQLEQYKTESMANFVLPSCDQKFSKTSATTAAMNLPSCSKTTINDYPDSINFDQSMDDTVPLHKASIPSGVTKVQSPVTSDEIQATPSSKIIENFAQSTSSKASLNKLVSISTLKNNDNIQCIPETSHVENVSDQFEYDRELESKNEGAANEGNAKKRKRKKDNVDETTNDKKRKKKELMLKKQKEKSRKELEKEAGRLNTTEHCIELMSVQADRRLLEVDGGEEIWYHLKKSKAHCKIAENTIKNTILWKRGSIEIIENDEEVVSECATADTENVIVYIPCIDFLRKASNEYNKDGCSSGLIAFVKLIKETLRKKVVYVFVDQMASCFRNNGSTTKTEWENALNRSQLQSVLLNLHFRTDAQVFMVDNMEIVGDMMARLIKAAAQKPFKKSSSPTFDFFVETGSGGGKKISEKIDSVSEVWKDALLRLHNLGSNTADAIVNEYKTPRQLIMAYKSNPEDGNVLLANIKARRGVAVSSERRIGPALSRNIHKIFTSQLPLEEI